ncbi:tannase and feruloyl esterase [Hypoxylon crocopeplum]|nr:tannase and feruloyl esterase [Hypoxylon crocopeplum]
MGHSVMCSPSNIPYPDLPGAQFTSLGASLVSNLTIQIPESAYTNNGALNVQGVSFCNVTTTYTHGEGTETVTISVYLPETNWNGRMQGIGGGGWNAGGLHFPPASMSMLGAVAEGYSAATDAGHASLDPEDWVLLSPGHVNLRLLEDFGSTSLNELSIIGKAITKSYYGKPPTYSYWNGCSQGGRQGMKLAEKYPTAFDGIVASAPALDLAGLGVGDLWPQVVMNTMDQYPKNCELVAITQAAVEYCDGFDGLIDGIISNPDTCNFDPYSIVDRPLTCNDTGTPEMVHISKTAAQIANATWTGARKIDNSFLWWGIKKGARLVEENVGFVIIPGLATTVCLQNGTCAGKPMEISDQWTRLIVKKDHSFDVSTITAVEFEDLFRASMEEYGSIFNVEPNLNAFRDAGGKVMSYHGLADTVIPPDSTRHLYERIAAQDKYVHEYYRLFEAPGLDHCYSGAGGYYPAGLFKALVSWVEDGIHPDKLVASTPPLNGSTHESILCPYPQKAYYNGLGSSATADDFYCDE